jgi:xanthine/CO dehydrogenase XdhC/CoxF family maturation factor
MSLSLQRLLPLFDSERALARPMVLATVLQTAGPTYSKPGALMLITGSGEYAGLLSGGCLEGDLAEHGRAVLAGGSPKLVRYDMRGPDDLLFGLGSGCEGAMDILLQRLDAGNDWQPMTRLAQAWRSQQALALLLVIHSTDPSWPVGSGVFAGDAHSFGAVGTGTRLAALASELRLPPSSAVMPAVLPGIDVMALLQPPPSQLLLLGAGPDAQPVAQLAAFLGWRLSVIDHRSHYAQGAGFPQATQVLDSGPAGLAALLARPEVTTFDAAIVMSHHLSTDLAYLRALASSDIPYVGLLGPPVRRERLLADLGSDAARLRPRLRAPIGLDLGAGTPEGIALSIVAEIHAALAGDASMQPLSRRQA